MNTTNIKEDKFLLQIKEIKKNIEEIKVLLKELKELKESNELNKLKQNNIQLENIGESSGNPNYQFNRKYEYTIC